MTIYLVRLFKPNQYEISTFVDGSKESISVYKVTLRNNNYYCDCPGYWRQKVKEDHKHCRIVKFWIENLDMEMGYCFWLDNENNIEYHKFITKEIERYVLDNS